MNVDEIKQRMRRLRHALRTWPRPHQEGEQAACLFCDTLHEAVDVDEGEAADCRRCGHMIYENRPASLVRALCFSLTALLMMAMAQSLPFLTLEAAGIKRELTLFNAATALMKNDAPVLGCSVILFTIVVPLFLIIGMIYTTIPLRWGRCAPGAERIIKWLYRSEPWNMVEVFLLGVLVSLLKLVQVADVAINAGFWSFAAVMICMAGALAGIDRRELWDRIELAKIPDKSTRQDESGPLIHGLPPIISAPSVTASAHGGDFRLPIIKAADCGLAACRTCGKVSTVADHDRCPRCHSRLYTRKPDSVQNTLALVAAATALFIPSHVLPMMRVTELGLSTDKTIIAGIITFWEDGAYPIALVIFCASLLIPILKITSLLWLCAAAKGKVHPKPVTLGKVYSITELLGRWSMIDIFVVGIMTSLVQFGSYTSMLPQAGALAFASVVVLTMFAAMNFDPRLLWDRLDDPDCQAADEKLPEALPDTQP